MCRKLNKKRSHSKDQYEKQIKRTKGVLQKKLAIENKGQKKSAGLGLRFLLIVTKDK